MQTTMRATDATSIGIENTSFKEKYKQVMLQRTLQREQPTYRNKGIWFLLQKLVKKPYQKYHKVKKNKVEKSREN